jgi:isopentenyldiphosphate isomerase
MSTEELVDIVDDDDQVIGQVTRSQMRREVLLHRVVAVLCMNSRGEIFVHRRTTTKDVFPGLYDMFAAGTVQAGESYETTAVRELAEELGVSGVPLERLFHHLYRGTATRAHTEVYRVVWDGPIVTQASEIAWGEFRTREAILTNHEGFELVPDGAELFARYVALY